MFRQYTLRDLNYGGHFEVVVSNENSEAGKLLQRAVLLSAGLANRRPRADIVATYPKAAQFYRDCHALDRRLATRENNIDILNITDLIELIFSSPPRDIVLATAHHGHFVAFFCACARAGIPLAACYRSASANYLAALADSGVALIDLDEMSNARQVFEAFDRVRSNGRYLALMTDAPFASRRRYAFLGYDVAVSSTPWLYARRSQASLLPLVSEVISTTLLGYTAGRLLEAPRTDCTGELLQFLESIILRQPEQYAWSNSILLSDASAREKAISFTLDALEWRHTTLHRT